MSKYFKEIKGNLVEFPNGINIIGHCANCQNVMGSGIALVIKDLFPAAWQADQDTKAGDAKKFGSLSKAVVKVDGKSKVICNIYGQWIPDTSKRAVNYDRLAMGVEELMKRASAQKGARVGFPKLMGSDRAGGDWQIIEAIIKTYAEKYEVETVIVDFNN
jgi:O-acetyl-ADP-ribose deacetylase (regulator of RNase III)